MPEKTMKYSKSVILLRLILPCLLVVVLLFPGLVVPARAVLVDYNDYVTNVQVDGDNDIVTVRIPADLAFVRVFNTATNKEIYRGYGLSHSIPFEKDVSYQVRINIMGYPYSTDYGLDLSYIPVGTEITSGFGFLFDGDWGVMSSPYPVVHYSYYGASSVVELEVDSKYLADQQSQWDSFTDTYVVQSVSNAGRLGIVYHVTPCEWFSDSPTDLAPVGITVNDTVMTFSISSLLRQQQLTGKTNALLKEVEKQLAEQGKTLDDIRDQMEETNDKLDKLPGEIGDEMQDVIDQEKQEAESSGNDFVDQILDALPDPSTEVLGALKLLTDSTAYTGTDAVLPIPAIVLPGIAGLFPKTEIWGGTNFDFGEYIQLLPSTLLTLVQALFTIAIVIFCVYELKGIISYCLTLRSNKGD